MAHHEQNDKLQKYLPWAAKNTLLKGAAILQVARRAIALTTRRCHSQSEVPDTQGAGKAREKYVYSDKTENWSQEEPRGKFSSYLHYHWRSLSLHQLAAASPL